MKNNFDNELKKVIELLQDKNVKLSARETLYNEFCSKYPYFDSSRLDKYFS